MKKIYNNEHVSRTNRLVLKFMEDQDSVSDQEALDIFCDTFDVNEDQVDQFFGATTFVPEDFPYETATA